MAINKKLIHFKTKAAFETELAANNILDTSICFIKETTEIYTHGLLYTCSDFLASDEYRALQDADSELRKLLVGEDVVAGDILMYNKTTDTKEFVLFNELSAEAYPADTYEPVGVVAIPSSHDVYGTGECGIISLKNMSRTTPDTGTTSNENIYWGGYATDTSLTNFTQVPQFGIASDQTDSLSAAPNIAYLPSDVFNVQVSIVDPEAYYSSTSREAIPSPYLADGSRNPAYYMTDGVTANTLSDFDGVGNTEVLLNLATAEDWKTLDTISNSYSANYYPAAECTWRFHTSGTNQGDWYLPACGELGYVVVRMKAINSTITTLNDIYGTVGSIISMLPYNSSSEYSALHSWFINFTNGYTGYANKLNVNYARAFYRYAPDSGSYATKKELLNAVDSLATVATTGSYSDLTDTPTIPTKTSDLTNDSNYLTEHQSLKTINGESLVGSGDITISGDGSSLTADNEDIEINNSTIRLKDKEYDSDNYSGYGRVYVRKNLNESGINILDVDVFDKDTTIYIIQYDFDLNNETLIMPADSILLFEGGSISNGTIILSSLIRNTADNAIFKNIEFSGFAQADYVSPKWFGALPNSTLDSTEYMRTALLFSTNFNIPLQISDQEEYYITGPLNYYNNTYNSMKITVVGNPQRVALEYSHTNSKGGFKLTAGTSLFKGTSENKVVINGSIANLYITGSGSDIKIFDYCDVNWAHIDSCYVASVEAFLYDSLLQNTTIVENSRFVSCKYFLKSVNRECLLVDSTIRCNYINGGSDLSNNACFMFAYYNGSTIINNFIDYYRTIFYYIDPERTTSNSSVQSISNQYQVFRYLYYREDSVTGIEFYSANDSFNWTLPSSLSELQSVTALQYTGKDGNTYDLPPYILRPDQTSVITIENAKIESNVGNVIFFGVESQTTSYSYARCKFSCNKTLSASDISFAEGGNAQYNNGSYPENYKYFDIQNLKEEVTELPEITNDWCSRPLGYKLCYNKKYYRAVPTYDSTGTLNGARWAEDDAELNVTLTDTDKLVWVNSNGELEGMTKPSGYDYLLGDVGSWRISQGSGSVGFYFRQVDPVTLKMLDDAVESRIECATTTTAGVMSPEDKIKLDNTKAVSAGQGITISEDGTISCEWVPAKYYTGSTAPSSSVGSDNDLYLQIAD